MNVINYIAVAIGVRYCLKMFAEYNRISLRELGHIFTFIHCTFSKDLNWWDLLRRTVFK